MRRIISTPPSASGSPSAEEQAALVAPLEEAFAAVPAESELVERIAAYEAADPDSRIPELYAIVGTELDRLSWGRYRLARLVLATRGITNTGYLFGLPAPGDNTEAVITTNAIIWDVMADTSAKAPSHFGWNRWVQGWLTDDEVSCLDPSGKSTVLLTPANATVSGKKLAVVPISFTLEVVIESKRTDAFDEFDPTGDGVVVYLVDTQKSSAAGAISVLTRNKFLDSSGAPVIGTLRPGDSLQVNDFVITYRGVFEEGDLVTVEVVG